MLFVGRIPGAMSSGPVRQRHRDDDHEESYEGQGPRNRSAVRVQAKMRVRVPGFCAGREHGSGKGDWQGDAGRRSPDLTQKCPRRRDEHARGADVERKMNRTQMARHLLHGSRLDSGVQQPVPDCVEDVAEKLQDERGPDPRSSRLVLHNHLDICVGVTLGQRVDDSKTHCSRRSPRRRKRIRRSGRNRRQSSRRRGPLGPAAPAPATRRAAPPRRRSPAPGGRRGR